MRTYLGIEFGSTKIKAVQVDEKLHPVSAGEYGWASRFENGVWTYDLEEVWQGLLSAMRGITQPETVACLGISGMMHGYLAFDADWKLLTPFRTWQNTITAQAADKLTEAFRFNVPQRWSIAHLYQAVLNGESHVGGVAHITTLAGYIHYRLTGVNAVGIGDASGMFPVDGEKGCFDEEMLEQFAALTREQPWDIRAVLPDVLKAGQAAGSLTEAGARLLGGGIPAGTPLAPPEGDAATGMTATNSVAVGTGNVSAGTSIFSMVVLERPLSRVYQEIDIVATPDGRPVAMAHCNNGTNDMNEWVRLLAETLSLMGVEPDMGALFTRLYQKSLEGAPDCAGVTVYNYLAGEGITHLDEGRPMVVRRADGTFNLANFVRANLYAIMATLRLGMDILREEKVEIRGLTGHGGFFKTPGVGQRYLAAACGVPITCMETAGEGGPFGMALLAAYRLAGGGRPFDVYLQQEVFDSAVSTTLAPDPQDVAGFEKFMERFSAGLPVERAAVQLL